MSAESIFINIKLRVLLKQEKSVHTSTISNGLKAHVMYRIHSLIYRDNEIFATVD